MRDREGGKNKKEVGLHVCAPTCMRRPCLSFAASGVGSWYARAPSALQYRSGVFVVAKYCTVPPRVTDTLDGARHLLYLAFARHSQSATPQTNLQSRGPLISHPSKPYCTLCIPAVLVHGFFFPHAARFGAPNARHHPSQQASKRRFGLF